jgi:hypothetical protein
LIAVLLPLGSKEMAQPDWDLEWLVTMPVERSTCCGARAGTQCQQRQSAGWVAAGLWRHRLACRHMDRAAGGLLAAVVLLPLAAMLHTLADTGLRMWLPASQLRNLQAVTGCSTCR